MWSRFRGLPTALQWMVTVGLSAALVASVLVAAETDTAAPALSDRSTQVIRELPSVTDDGGARAPLSYGDLRLADDAVTGRQSAGVIRSRTARGPLLGRDTPAPRASFEFPAGNPIQPIVQLPAPVTHSASADLTADEAERLVLRETGRIVAEAELGARQEPSIICGILFSALGRLNILFRLIANRFRFLVPIFNRAFNVIFGLLQRFDCPLPSPG